jgi:hypothetical protein
MYLAVNHSCHYPTESAASRNPSTSAVLSVTMRRWPWSFLLVLLAQSQLTVAFLPSSSSRSLTSRTSQPTCYYVTKQPLEDWTTLVNDDDDDEEDEGARHFYDVDYLDDDEDSTGLPLSSSFDREESEMLAELENRFYIDDRGRRRKVEKCILVGVEDLSAKRKLQKAQRQELLFRQTSPYVYDSLPTTTTTAAAAAAAQDEAEMMFTLEESLTEMRELIKTAGMDCVGGEYCTVHLPCWSLLQYSTCTAFCRHEPLFSYHSPPL